MGSTGLLEDGLLILAEAAKPRRDVGVHHVNVSTAAAAATRPTPAFAAFAGPGRRKQWRREDGLEAGGWDGLGREGGR